MGTPGTKHTGLSSDQAAPHCHVVLSVYSDIGIKSVHYFTNKMGLILN